MKTNSLNFSVGKRLKFRKLDAIKLASSDDIGDFGTIAIFVNQVLSENENVIVLLWTTKTSATNACSFKDGYTPPPYNRITVVGGKNP